MRRLLAFVLVGFAAVGCSSEATVSSEPAPDFGEESVTTTSASTGTTVPDYLAIYGEFVDDWNQAWETGSLPHLRRVVHPESLHLYGEDACAAYIQTLEPIPTPFQLRWSKDSEYGFTSVEMDGVLVSVFLADVQQIIHADGRFEATWASPFAYGSRDDWQWPLHAAVLLDCGDRIEGRYPLMLAELAEPNDETGFVAQTVDFHAPDQWWIDVWVRNGECDVAILDPASEETLLRHKVRYHTAAELGFSGPLAIKAEGDCRWVRAVTDPALVTTDITDLVPDPASVWMPTIMENDAGEGIWIMLVNSGEVPQDLTGWELHIERSEPYVFSDGFEIGPIVQVEVHPGCGEDTEGRLFLCLDDETLDGRRIELLDAAGTHMDGFGTGGG